MSMPEPPASEAGPTPAPPSAPAPAQAQPAAPPAQAPAPPAPPTPPPVPQPPTWTPPQPAEHDDGEDLSRLPKKWQDEVRRLREESAKYRTSARAERVRLHAYTTAAELGVNPAALLGSTAFAEAAKSLDPNGEDFPARLAETVQRILAANPWMAAQPPQPAEPPAPAAPPPPARSGGDFPGSPGEGQPITEEQLARMKPEEIAAALQAGKLKHLL